MPGSAADQEGRAGHQPAAADPVELREAGDAARHRRADAGEPDELDPPPLAAAGESLRWALGDGLLDQRVPAAAGFAAPGPLHMHRAAFLQT